MVGQLMVLNPKRRKRRSAPRRMTALQRKYFGKRRSKRRPAARAVMAENPRRHRKHRAPRSSRRRVMRFRRNPSLGGGDSVMNIFGAAAIGAGAAIGVNLIWSSLQNSGNIPQQLQSGMAVPLAQAAVGVGIGYAAGELMGKRFGAQVMAGALTVTAYGVLRTWLAQNTQLQLAGARDRGRGRVRYGRGGVGRFYAQRLAGPRMMRARIRRRRLARFFASGLAGRFNQARLAARPTSSIPMFASGGARRRGLGYVSSAPVFGGRF